MRLSSRIYKLAELVSKGETAADIGTDHGYVPMLLIKNDISPRLIMSDISEASLAKARDTFRMLSLPVDENDFRTGDGLEPIRPAETDVIIIAGLGGHTISEILDADILKSRSFKKLILQPRKHAGALRHYLYTRGWDISGEYLATEGKFECEIITASPSETDYRNEIYPKEDIRWKYPAGLAESDPDRYAQRLEWKIGSIDKQIQNLKANSGNAHDLLESLENDREYLAGLLDKCRMNR